MAAAVARHPLQPSPPRDKPVWSVHACNPNRVRQSTRHDAHPHASQPAPSHLLRVRGARPQPVMRRMWRRLSWRRRAAATVLQQRPAPVLLHAAAPERPLRRLRRVVAAHGRPTRRCPRSTRRGCRRGLSGWWLQKIGRRRRIALSAARLGGGRFVPVRCRERFGQSWVNNLRGSGWYVYWARAPWERLVLWPGPSPTGSRQMLGPPSPSVDRQQLVHSNRTFNARFRCARAAPPGRRRCHPKMLGPRPAFESVHPDARWRPPPVSRRSSDP